MSEFHIIKHGRDGTQGVPGIQGTPGIQGIPGNDGADGAQGIPGNDGADGADGSPDTPEQVRDKYESLTDRNAYTDAEKAAVADIANKYDASNPAAYITQAQVDASIAAVINGEETGGTFDDPADGQPVTGGAT